MSINMSATTVPSRLASLFHRNGNDPANNSGLSARLEEPEATTNERTIGAATGAAFQIGSKTPVDPDQITKARRRRYSKAEKLRILRLADACHERGQLGALLRREGIYHSTLRDFQKQRANGHLEAGYEHDKQLARTEADQHKKRIAELEAQNCQLQHKLEQAQLIIDVQKKLSQLLGISLPPTQPRGQEGNATSS
jgi:transposase-like protein